MKLLKDIAKKTPLNLRVGGKLSPLPLGNCSMIAYDNDKYLCAYREFHYFLANGQYINMPGIPCPGIGMCFLDRDFNPIVDFSNKPVLITRNPYGISDNAWEDPRVFKWNGKVFMSCSSINTKMNNPWGRVAIQVFRIVKTSKNHLQANGTFNSRKYLSDSACEKNWMAIPSRNGDMIQLIAKNGINVVNTINKTMRAIPSKIIVSDNLRGNTPLIEIDGKYFGIVHYRNGMDYYHQFLVFDMNLQIEHISQPFKFDTVFPTEFCSSIFNVIDSDDIGITVCENDCFQYVYTLDRKTLMDFVFENTPSRYVQDELF